MNETKDFHFIGMILRSAPLLKREVRVHLVAPVLDQVGDRRLLDVDNQETWRLSLPVVYLSKQLPNAIQVIGRAIMVFCFPQFPSPLARSGPLRW